MQPQRKKQVNSLVAATAVLLICAGAILVGCSDGGKQAGTTAPVPVKPKQQVASQPTATVVEEAPKPAFSYNPEGRRDPFAPLIVREERRAQSGDRPPLERYNLHDFKLSGIVWGGFGYNAMLEAPDGKGYFVRKGSVLGPNKGVVKKITPTTVVVEEKFKSVSGEVDRKEIVIELRKKQEGMQ